MYNTRAAACGTNGQDSGQGRGRGDGCGGQCPPGTGTLNKGFNPTSGHVEIPRVTSTTLARILQQCEKSVQQKIDDSFLIP